ncbi:hypothetical protein TWF506_008235 [Arthrobotrys conoides]|uniref:Uncharacterized protein n=1 Tax=Arthrobotrys conoides TaxID=74498 RepID=A0AAN8RMJ2_9PEZI
MYRRILSAAPAILKTIPYLCARARSKLPSSISIPKRYTTLLTPPPFITSDFRSHDANFLVEYAEIKPGAITKYSQPIDVEPCIVGDSETDYRSIVFSSLLIQEFKKANIGMTEYGTQILQNTCTSFEAHDLYDYCGQLDFRKCLLDEIFNGPIDLPDLPPITPKLKQLNHRSKPDSGRMSYVPCRYEEFKVYLMWEALYYRSTYMRDVIEEAENIAGNAIRGDRITTSPWWYSLGMMYSLGMVVREDVDGLPDPIVYYKEFSKDAEAA